MKKAEQGMSKHAQLINDSRSNPQRRTPGSGQDQRPIMARKAL